MSREIDRIREQLERREPPERVDAIARRVIGAAIEVHRQLGPGFLEAAYVSAFDAELTHRGIAFQRQVPIPLKFRNSVIGQARLDLLVEEELVVEIKAVERIVPIHLAQLISYLRATDLCLGLPTAAFDPIRP